MHRPPSLISNSKTNPSSLRPLYFVDTFESRNQTRRNEKMRGQKKTKQTETNRGTENGADSRF